MAEQLASSPPQQSEQVNRAAFVETAYGLSRLGIAVAALLLATELLTVTGLLAWLAPPMLGLPHWFGWVLGAIAVAISGWVTFTFVDDTCRR